MLLPRASAQEIGSDRPIIYSSTTLSLCQSPPESPRLSLQAQSQLQPLSSLLSPIVAKEPELSPSTSPLRPSLLPQTPSDPENQHPSDVHSSKKIQELMEELQLQKEQLAKQTAALVSSQDSEAQWRRRAMEAEAQMQSTQSDSTQRSKLVDELKSEAALWRSKFNELLEEHAALQARLESATSQATLLGKALTTLRSDNAELAAALTTAESALTRQKTQLESAEKDAMVAAAQIATLKDEERKLLDQLDTERASGSLMAAQLAAKEEKLSTSNKRNQALNVQIESLNAEKQKMAEKLVILEEQKSGDPTAMAGPNEAKLRETSSNNGDKTVNKQQNEVLASQRDVIVVKETVAPVAAGSEPMKSRAMATTMASILKSEEPAQPKRTLSNFESSKALMARTAELEASMLSLNIEKSALEAERAKFPSTSRTVAERKRKSQVEGRIAELGREISSIRMEMRKLGCK